MLVSGEPAPNAPYSPPPQKKVLIDIDARLGRAESQFMLNKSNLSLLRADISEKKDTIHTTKTFAKKELEFWNRTDLHNLEILSEYPTN